jgi:hypothetical protein
LDGETIKNKVIDLDDSYNFAVENFFICIHLGSYILILKLDEEYEDNEYLIWTQVTYGWSDYGRYAVGCGF